MFIIIKYNALWVIDCTDKIKKYINNNLKINKKIVMLIRIIEMSIKDNDI